MFDLQQIRGAGLEEALRQMPAVVVVAEVPSRRIIFSNRQAQEIMRNLGRSMPPDLEAFRSLHDSGDFEIFRADGRAFEPEEWPLTRAIENGEEVRDEEYFYVLADGSKATMRCDASPICDDEGRIVAGVGIYKDITERKRTEEQLVHYARLRENTQDAFIATDERLTVTAWNRGAEEMYGWAADEALGRRVDEIIPLELDDEQLAGVFRELEETGRLRAEQVQYRKDGTPVNVDSLTIATRDGRGEVTGAILIVRDITRRKEADAEQQRLVDIVQNSPDFIGIADLDWRATFLNEAGQRMVGLDGIEEVRRTTVPDFFMPEDRAFLQDEIVPLVMNEGRWAGELNLRHFGTGEPIPVLCDGFRVDDPQTGEPIGLATVTRDITERKRAERAIRTRAREQAVVADLGLRALANHGLQSLMDDAVALVARTLDVELCKVIEVLPGGEEVLLRAGIGWEEGLAENATERVEDDPQVGYILRSGEPVITEDLSEETRFLPSPLLRAHGVTSCVAVAIPGREGPFGVVGAHTAGHRTFSEDDANFLQAVANVLATAIEREEAAEKLEGVREAERGKLARDLHDEGLQDLAYAMAEAQIIRAGSEDAELARRLESLRVVLGRVEQQMRGAIYDLRLGGERDRDFSELLEALVEHHRAMAPGREISLDLADGVLSGSLGDKGRDILRIVGEALTNTRRHSEAGNVRVVLKSSEEKLWAEVSDDGRGFDPAAEPSAGVSGGIGLKGMRERARALAGEMKIESEPGGGTKVVFEMSLAEGRGEPEEKVRVLLVEDHAAVREAIASTFEREAGFEIVGQAASLEEARRMIIAEEPVDVAVVDLGLPDGYGGDLIKDLREANPEAQALVLSASLDRAETARAVENGAAGALHKTAHLEEIVDAVRRLRAGETLLPLDEVVELLRFAASTREQEYRARRAVARLTPREIEVLEALAEGLDSEGIAGRLHISIRTQRNHMTNILSKLEVHSQLQALVLALRYGVVEIPGRK